MCLAGPWGRVKLQIPVAERGVPVPGLDLNTSALAGQ